MMKKGFLESLKWLGIIILLLFVAGCTCATQATCGLFKEAKRDHCIQGIAIKTNNPELCAEIVDGAPRNKCYDELAFINRDPKFCKRIDSGAASPYVGYRGGGYTKMLCLTRIAVATGDLELCNVAGFDAREDERELCRYEVLKRACVDSDGGKNYVVGGWCEDSKGGEGYDYCHKGGLEEFYCTTKGIITCAGDTVDCNVYCKNKGFSSGTCKGEPAYASCKCS